MVALLPSVLLSVTSAIIHYEVLMHLKLKLPTVQWVSRRAKVLVVILVAIACPMHCRSFSSPVPTM